MTFCTIGSNSQYVLTNDFSQCGKMATATTTSSSPALLLDAENHDAPTSVTVHPLVLLSVLDHHTRRQEAEGRVIGTLLGRRDGTKVEVTNCFAVPHAERGDEVAIGKDFNKQMLALHLKSNPKEVVVGWYASTPSLQTEMTLVADTSSLIHDFYATETEEGDPVHLVVDTRLSTDSIPIVAYSSTSVSIQSEPLANLFHEIPLELTSTEAESICLQAMQEGSVTTASTTTDAGLSQDKALATTLLQASMTQLRDLLAAVLIYVNEVVEGKRIPDPVMGRKIADTLTCVPRIRPEVFETLFHDKLQDLLMVTYLSNITKTQLTVAEKLTATLGIKE